MTCVKFAAVGDWGSGDPNQYKLGDVIRNLYSENLIKFVCGLGDNIYPNGINSNNDQLEITNKFTLPFTNIKIPPVIRCHEKVIF